MKIIKQAHQLILTLVIFFTFSGLHAQQGNGGSWGDYISYLKNENVIETAHIFFKSDNQIVAASSSSGYVSNKAEFDGILNYIKTKGQSGLTVNGERYMTVRFDNENINKVGYLKKNKGGACIVETNQTIIFGSWNANLKQANNQTQNGQSANARVEALGKLLRDANY
jgi:hypothetical protein